MQAVSLQVTRLVVGVALVAALVSGCSGHPAPAVSQTQSTPRSSASVSAEAAAVAAARVKARAMSDEELVGQLLMPSVGLSESPAVAAQLVRTYHLGGVILMGNVKNTGTSGTAQQVRALTDGLHAAAASLPAKTDLLIGTDQEYGWVTRIRSGMVQLPSAMAFGAAARPDLTETAWRGAGAELAALGINVDFAPDADVVDSPDNYIIGSRSFGADPAAVGAQVAAAVRGLQAGGVAAAIKHFPGHGHTTTDSHDELPVLSQSRQSLTHDDLPPFQAGIDAGTWLVMAGHLDVEAIDPGVPATFSHKVLVDLLRDQLGFTGVVVTDALNMKPAMRWSPGEAATLSVLAGADVLLMPVDLAAAQQGLLAALHSGRLPRARLLEAAERVLTLKIRLATYTRPALTTLNNPANRAAAHAVAAAAVTVLRGPCTGSIVHGAVQITGSTGREAQRDWLIAALRAHGVTVVQSGGQLIHLLGYGDGTSDLAVAADVTVSMDTPYVLTGADSAVRVATYSSTQVAMEALAAVLVGEAKATGRSPVDVAGLPRTACVS